MSRVRHESGCGRCIFFAVDHFGGLRGWSWVLVRFAWHRLSGECAAMEAKLRAADRAGAAVAQTGPTRPAA